MKKNKKILDDGRHSDLYIKQYDRKINSSRTEIHKNPGAAVFLCNRKDRLRRSLELKRARTEAGMTSR